MRGCLTWKMDPGPCPVDDTPHTACTPESVARQHAITVAARRPRALDQLPPPAPPAPTFTTDTYRRALHGPKRKGK